jgi:dihydrofolate reductase
MKASVFIATSLDGFIARANGDIDWLPTGDQDDDFGYGAFMASVDVLVMGRNTFETCLRFPEWPYAGRRVVVLTRRPLDVPSHIAGVTVSAGEPYALLSELAASGATHAYVDGGLTIQSFLEAGAIDEMTITRIPILLGSGIPLFGALSRDVHLDHLGTRSYSNGFVQSTYAIRGETR